MDDVGWVNPWTVVLRRDTRERLARAGTGLMTAETSIHDERGRRADLLELAADPTDHVELVMDREPACPECGRGPGQLPDELVFRVARAELARPLLRPRDFPTLLLATEQFARAVGRLGVAAVRFAEVEVR